ncbi:hypothetical protein, partial [Sediminicola sp. 1XM1-17]|uniref:hypothetical protein n=1 Tax=Sediminicola sp. 1XM1-17 TaxID=3127702 RepID=UPI0030772524
TQNAVKTYVDNEITASNQTIVSGDAGNIINIGTDGGSILTSLNDADADPANEIQNINEVLTDGNNAGGIVIQNIGAPIAGTDAANKDYVDNAITASNPIKAYGYITFSPVGGAAVGVSLVTRIAAGQYRLTFSAGNSRTSTIYPIQLTHFGSGTENVDIFVSNQTTTTFDINITQSGGYVDRIFYFTVLDF